jgi:hypothetical protein
MSFNWALDVKVVKAGNCLIDDGLKLLLEMALVAV